MSRRSFTLIELMAVVLILAILAGLAVPRFRDFRSEARRGNIRSVIGSVRTGYAQLLVAYKTGMTAGLPPDSNGDGFPDHLGDVAAGETLLLEAVLDPPLVSDPDGWHQFTGGPFPQATNYTYVYDVNGNDVFDSGTDGYIIYNSVNGYLATWSPP